MTKAYFKAINITKDNHNDLGVNQEYIMYVCTPKRDHQNIGNKNWSNCKGK